MFRKIGLLLASLYFVSLSVSSQNSVFSNIEIITDTSSFNSNEHSVFVNNEKRNFFKYTNEKQIVEIRLFSDINVKNLELKTSRDFELIDSLLFTGEYYRFKIRFANLNTTDLLRITLMYGSDSVKYAEINLQPVTSTTAGLRITDNQLFIGEEKVYEVFSNNTDNIKVQREWKSTDNFDYRYTLEGGRLYLHIVPQKLGNQLLELTLSANKPDISTDHKLIYSLPPLIQLFNVKASRLQYLGLDKTEITLSEETKTDGTEIQIDNSSLLLMNKTYRIEAQEESGGSLIAELYTKQRLGNNKVLCVLRPYNFHRSSKGYLYIKDGDKAKFITNLSITPATEISQILILYEGNQWRQSNTVRPGQTIDLKLVGEGMHKANFYFEDLVLIENDSLVQTENQQIFRLKIPQDVSKKTINIYNHSEITGSVLKVAEYQRPREFDFIYIDYGEMARRVSGIKEPIFYEGVVKDLVLSFNTNKIDDDALYGKQYLDLEVRISGRKNELVELKTIENIVVCPSGRSPRSEYYSNSDCITGDISLNKYLRKETSDLEDWSRISVNIAHRNDKYQEKIYEKEIDIILKRRYSFDIELSFPAGLITISKNDTGSLGFGSLSGISLAMIGQFSFYHPEKINRYRPFKIGAGFLALNAFNFSDNANTNRDVGLVIIGSLYPTTRDAKLSFPLYIGGGYFIKDEKFFFLIGPGIRLRL